MQKIYLTISLLLFLIPVLVINYQPQNVRNQLTITTTIQDSIQTTFVVDSCYTKEDLGDSLYQEIINHIKDSEGFRDTIYIDTNGKPTIGYGHQLLEGEEFILPISELEATEILKKDFNKRVDDVEKYHKLQGSKAKAIALFIYNCGSGTYARSSLKLAVNSNKPIDNIIIKYCKFQQNGKYHFSKGLLLRRKFELLIYNS